MTTQITLGVLIPFIGTSLGSALVFLLKSDVFYPDGPCFFPR